MSKLPVEAAPRSIGDDIATLLSVSPVLLGEAATRSPVYRFDSADGSVRRMVDLGQPNGLAFAPDGRTLYVSNTSRTEGSDGHTIYAYPVCDDANFGEGQVFAEIGAGVPDGFRVDRRSWMWTSSEAGVQVFSAEGHRLGLIPTPQLCSKWCFGPCEERLFITSKQHLYTLDLAGG